MSEFPVADRRYSEKEVSRLLRRAAELQRSSPTSPNPSGLSLRELEEIALEAGIDPAALRQAATELDVRHPAAGTAATLLGAPLKLVLERTLPFEAPESAFETLIPHIQIASTTPGQASQIGRTFTWQAQAREATLALQVIITVRRGETLIRIEESRGTFAGALYGGGLGGTAGIAMAAAAITGKVAGSVLLATGVPALLVGGAYAAFRAIFAAKHRSRQRILSDLLEKMTEELTHAAGTPRD